ncbi:hypothetical protein DH2020_042400 [Rehmannia glutinosa]|uniref:Acetylajmalan esterase-like n=1 Tax=Rehmannia glutinosa TaxID=99300 RepID=A0ABR0UN43_REHGL
MASLLQKSLFLFLALCCLTQYTNAHPLKICKLDQIYQLGDSISDTGNFIRQIPIETASAFARLSYGETIFNNATGRCSNGLLIIDHIVKLETEHVANPSNRRNQHHTNKPLQNRANTHVLFRPQPRRKKNRRGQCIALPGDTQHPALFSIYATYSNPSHLLSSFQDQAMAAGLPFVRPYKNMDGHFKHGVNFAVAGSTALPSQVLASKHIFCPVTTTSLHVQLEWMFTHFNSICFDHTDCVDKLENALFMVGEIGGNDYNYAFFQGKTMEELKSMVPDVVESIMDAAKKVINLGAQRVVIPGNFPIGCRPIYQTVFQSNISEAYDENQCLNQFNEFAQYHNEQLQQAIFKLQQEKPNAIVVYGDYYNAYQFLLKFAYTSWACCGTGGKYNFDLKRMCGEDGDVPVCAEPNRYVSWDGVHLTQRGYKIMAAWLLHDIFPKLHCHF